MKSEDISSSDFRSNFSESLNRVRYGSDRLVICRNDKPVAALVNIDDLDIILGEIGEQ